MVWQVEARQTCTVKAVTGLCYESIFLHASGTVQPKFTRQHNPAQAPSCSTELGKAKPFSPSALYED